MDAKNDCQRCLKRWQSKYDVPDSGDTEGRLLRLLFSLPSGMDERNSAQRIG